MNIKETLISKLEEYVTSYVALIDPAYSLPIALWIIGTFCFESFDSYPYLVITSATKRSGKTRLKEMISFACANPLDFAAMTGATMFRAIEGKRKPTILFDEAEKLNSEAASTMRSVLNVGYRKGQKVPRALPGGNLAYFDTYCPKAFVLIGDVYDTLRDRSIVITMRRGEPAKRFTFDAAMSEGEELRNEIKKAVKAQKEAITAAFQEHTGLPFLMDRDEEIWTSLFVLCGLFAPNRLTELTRTASDMSAEKTSEARRYINLESEEDSAQKDEYRKRLLLDLHSLFVVGGFSTITSQDALKQLLEIPTAPWRKFKGEGLTMNVMADMLSIFHVRPIIIQTGKGRKERKVARGYKAQVVFDAVNGL